MSINRITDADVNEFIARPHLNTYQLIATKSAIYPGKGTPMGLMYVAIKGAGEAGEFAEHVGKAMRDDNLTPVVEVRGSVAEFMDPGEDALHKYVSLDGKLTAERRMQLIKEIGDQLWYLSAKCNELNITLADAAITNLRKLKDRTDRDALRGSGDDR